MLISEIYPFANNVQNCLPRPLCSYLLKTIYHVPLLIYFPPMGTPTYLLLKYCYTILIMLADMNHFGFKQEESFLSQIAFLLSNPVVCNLEVASFVQ